MNQTESRDENRLLSNLPSMSLQRLKMVETRCILRKDSGSYSQNQNLRDA